MTESKKAWSKPELVVVVRGKAEEQVLDGCKYWVISGPDRQNNDCRIAKNTYCDFCNMAVPS